MTSSIFTYTNYHSAQDTTIYSTIQQICHTIHVSVFKDASIHPSPKILSEQNIMNTIADNVFMVSHACICLSHHNVVKTLISDNMISWSHWMLYNWSLRTACLHLRNAPTDCLIVRLLCMLHNCCDSIRCKHKYE